MSLKEEHEARLRAMKAKEDAKLQTIAEAYADCFGTPAGKAVLADLASGVGLFTPWKGQPTSEQSQFVTGAHSVVQGILQRLKTASKEAQPTITLPL